MRRVAALFLGLSLSPSLLGAGCAPWLTAPDDYAAYRRTRVAPTLEDRLAAADAYLRKFPDGAFHEPVKASFDEAELVYYNAKQGTIAGLQGYLTTLPQGPHQGPAQGRLSALQRTRDHQDVAAETNSRLDLAELERRRARGEITAWIGRFLDASLWRAPLSQARVELIVPWAFVLPKPHCVEIEQGARRRCSKLLEVPYAVRVNGLNEPRQATVEILVIEDAEGRPLQASLGGPDLFLRLEETFSVRAIEPGDMERRVASIARAVEIVQGEFSRAISGDAACKGPVTAPVILDLGCQGVRVTARAATAPGDDDVVVMRPER